MSPTPSSSEPTPRPQPAGGFSVLDGVALVIGATVASIHLRELVEEQALSGFGWGLVWITFSGIALSAAGPFLFVVRRFLRRVPGYPRVGDGLWAVLGMPWVLAALLRSSEVSVAGGGLRPAAAVQAIEPYAACLWLAQAAASLVVLVVVWKTWVLATPEQLAAREPIPWTDRVGLALAVAWPLQCGFSLVAVG